MADAVECVRAREAERGLDERDRDARVDGREVVGVGLVVVLCEEADEHLNLGEFGLGRGFG